MLRIEKLKKSYGAEALFEDVSFIVNPGERVGLVGRNGHGKTTLMRIISGEESVDSGVVLAPKFYRIAHLSQHLDFTEKTVIAEAAGSIPADEDGCDQSWRADAILAGLGFGAEELAADPWTLSGGFQVRLNLVKALLSDPNLLLLDEPTNYLDIVSLRWLRGFLRAWRGELIIITHDRGFMDSVTTHTLGIHRRRVRKVMGPTWKLYEQIALEEEVHEKTRRNEEKKIQEVERFIERFRSKATKASLVQSRVKALEKKERLEVLGAIKNLDFEFNYSRYNPKVLMDVRGVSFSYDKDIEPIINNLSLTIGRRDRIAVVGRNGKGKSTFMNILAGGLEPCSGDVQRGLDMRPGYFAQTNVVRLDPERTIEEEMIAAEPDANRTRARSVCGAMLFEGDRALKKISVLSGGEKSRVMLGKILLSPINLLLLDEPTNHLDMDSVESLVEAIEAFDGAVVIVTHSETVLERVADRLLVFDRGRAELFEGTYGEFLDKVGWAGEEGAGGSKGNGKGRAREVGGVSKKEARRLRALIKKERTAALAPLRKRTTEVEAEITGLEKKLSELGVSLQDAYGSEDTDSIAALSKAHHETESRIESLFGELERLSADMDARAGAFDERLSALGGSTPLSSGGAE
jgi:ATP-binding cassette subfamily F protein 3